MTDVPFAQPAGYGYVVIDTDDEHPDLADFTVGPRETLCTACWLVHPPHACDLDA